MSSIDKRKQTRVQPAEGTEVAGLQAVERDLRGLKTLNKMQLELIRHIERLLEVRAPKRTFKRKPQPRNFDRLNVLVIT